MLPTHDRDRRVTRNTERKYDTLVQQYIHITLVVGAYWFVSILTVFVNKILLSGQQDFDAPMFVTWFQCAFTVIVCLFLKTFGCFFPGSGLGTFAAIPLSFWSLMKVLPLSLIFVLMIGFNNLCLKYVGVAFYYLARSLTTVTNVIFTFTILHQQVSPRAILCCAIITAGYFVGLDQEGIHGVITWRGIIYGVLSSCFVSLNSIYTKKVLPTVENSVLTLNLYNNMNAMILFVPLMFLNGELPSSIFVQQMLETTFWLLMVVGGLCGVAIGYVTALQIQVTSPLTHNISGTAKACAQTVLAVHAYHEVKSFAWWVSNFIVLFGSGLYARVQQLDMKRDFKKPATVGASDSRKLLGEVEEAIHKI